jgi:hypothetical protein
MFEIIEKEQEPSGQWRIRAIVSADESMFLWFGAEPAQADIDNAIDAQLQQRLLSNPVIVESGELKCTAWQFRKALNALGLRDAVEAAIAASGDQNIKDGWQYTSEFHRYAPLVIQFGQVLGKTGAEMDALFALAGTL